MATSDSMKAIQIKEFNQPFQVSQVPKPKPEAHQVLIKISAGGFCHTDLMALNNEFSSRLPYIGSHEPAGTIVELGSGVKGWSRGDRVGAMNFERVCGKCPDCKAGRSLYCDNPKMKGITTDGGWSEYMAADADWLIRLPDSVSFSSAAAHMCAGLTIYGSIAKAQLPPGGSVAIIGIGGLGHIGTQIAKCKGYTVVAVDSKQAALDLANEFKYKPDVSMLSPKDEKAEDKEIEAVLDKLEKICPDKSGYRGVDAAILATDQPPAFKVASKITKKHGKVVLVGQPAEGITMSFYDLIFKDLTLVGSLIGDIKQGEELMKMVDNGDVEVRIKEWKPEQAEDMRQEYLRGESNGKNVIMFA